MQEIIESNSYCSYAQQNPSQFIFSNIFLIPLNI